jgi:mono/diheme cytochrome c family protein
MRALRGPNRILWIFAILVAGVVVLAAVYGIVASRGNRTAVVPASRPPLIQTEQALINSYGWTNKDANVAHVPIQEAMKSIAQNGWPTLAALPTQAVTPVAGGGGGGGGGQSAGAQLFQQLGCSGCHQAANSAIAPTLHGIYGKLVALQDGSTVTADDAYIRESILNPTAEVVKGFNPIMPSFQGQVNDPQIQDLIDYIKSLGS